jgi:hypothetical protein
MQDGPSNRFALARVFVLAMLSASGLNAADREGGPTRLTPSEIHWPATGGNEAPGSSMQMGVQSPIIYGDTSNADLYSIMFKVGPNAAISAHCPPAAITPNPPMCAISQARNPKVPPSNVLRSGRHDVCQTKRRSSTRRVGHERLLHEGFSGD